MMVFLSKGNALLAALLTIVFFVLAGAIMWFLSGLAPLAEDYNAPQDTSDVLTYIPHASVASTASSTDYPDAQTVSEEVNNTPSAPHKDTSGDMITPTLNPLEGVYTNPFE
jgi:hypothetical protein